MSSLPRCELREWEAFNKHCGMKKERMGPRRPHALDPSPPAALSSGTTSVVGLLVPVNRVLWERRDQKGIAELDRLEPRTEKPLTRGTAPPGGGVLQVPTRDPKRSLLRKWYYQSEKELLLVVVNGQWSGNQCTELGAV